MLICTFGLFCVWFVSLAWNQGNSNPIDWVGKCFHHYFLSEIVNNKYYFYFKCLIQFTSESIWVWAFLCEKIFSCYINFFTWYMFLQTFYFFFVSFDNSRLFRKFFIPALLSNFWHEVFHRISWSFKLLSCWKWKLFFNS